VPGGLGQVETQLHTWHMSSLRTRPDPRHVLQARRRLPPEAKGSGPLTRVTCWVYKL
jgi:hypothetical protein